MTSPPFAVAWRVFLVGLAACGVWSLLAATAWVAPPALSYERDVRPILKTHCLHCHGEGGAIEGKLDLRLRRLTLKGGESGAAVVPGDPANSLLVQRLVAGEMPPEDVKHRPTETEVAAIAKWIEQGAVGTREEPENLNPDDYFTDDELNYWAFQPVRRPEPPLVPVSAAARTPIDQFVWHKLNEHGLSFSPDAERATLLRRVYVDLLGLPPTPDELHEFLADQSPNAYERLVDRVLASPRYGERWGRHWLDVAGYADSEGYTDDDPVRPDAYKYRDYVIRALNEDRPFDRFVVEQLAGDELIDGPLQNLTSAQIECLVATGFLRMVPDGTGAGGVDQNLARNEVVAHTIEVVSTSLLGLTVACAQCHDHRYDPIPQADYYSLRAIFEPALNWKNWLTPTQRRVSLLTDADRDTAAAIEKRAQEVDAARTARQAEFIERTFQAELAKVPAETRAAVAAARNQSDQQRTAEQKALLKQYPSVNVSAGSLYLYDRKAADELEKMSRDAQAIRDTKPREEFVRALWEPTGAPPQTFVFLRGEYEKPGPAVPPRELRVLNAAHVSFDGASRAADTRSSGRRLAYARWLTGGQHPLTARVLVNRLWMHHFGRGIVATPSDFGRLGSRPTHPELLDWLASEFVASGWSVKHLQRLILVSSGYRQAAVRTAAAEAVDAENALYSRWSVRRLDAESFRDGMLRLSGLLNERQFGPAVPVMADTVGQFVIGIENLDAGRPGQVLPLHGEQYRRSIYIQARRSRPLSSLAPFDLPAMEPNCTSRASSTVATQSLLVMNSEFLLEMAQAMAEHVRTTAGDDPRRQLELAWETAYAALPSQEQAAAAAAFLEQQTEAASAAAANGEAKAKPVEAKPAEAKPGEAQPPTPHDVALASFCHALLSSNRFLYVD